MSEASVYQQLRGHLAYLRLSAAAEALPGELEHAAAAKTGHSAFLERLLAVEVAAVETRRRASLDRFASLPAPWRLADFDFDAQPSIDRGMVNELATLRFLEDATNVLFIGPPGVGKTMLAVGLARASIDAGYRTYYTTAADLVARCHRAALEGRWATTMRFFAGPRLLVIDEVGRVGRPEWWVRDWRYIMLKAEALLARISHNGSVGVNMPRVAVPDGTESVVDRVWELCPALKPAWSVMKEAVASGTGLPIEVKEVVRYRLAGLNGCQLCLAGRSPAALQAGFDEETYRQIPFWRASTVLSPTQRAALEFTDLYALDHLRVDDALFVRLRCHFDDGEVVALAFLVARYLAFGRLAHVLMLDDACDLSVANT